MEKKKNKKEDESFNIDLGIGNLNLGGIFKGIENLVDLAEKLNKEGGEIKKEGNIDLSHLKKGMNGIFGFSVKTATGGKTVVESFGNIKKTPKGPSVDEEREPITDIFDEEDEVKIYAEMPGVNEEDIKLELKDDLLDISAKSENRTYHKEILIPENVKPETLTSTYKNGILNISIKK
ncbi:MAG: Hsp20/alpha crystallin family protein [Ignavibacteria bacterium]|jgi:HSP20 family protein